MDNIIIIGVILAAIGFAVGYVVRAKKIGKTCIGCPDNGSCPSQQSGKCSGNCTNCGDNQ